jgi:hypothetical protein
MSSGYAVGIDLGTYGDDLRSGSGIDAVMLPTRPYGGTAEWDAAVQSITVTGVDLDGNERTTLGTLTVIPASCDVGGGRVACATDTNFRVWKVDRG